MKQAPPTDDPLLELRGLTKTFCTGDTATRVLKGLDLTLPMDLIKTVNAEEKTTFLISTHDEKIAALCSYQIEIKDGRVAS